jgi:radical SAM superfamily enzyme YgiQ (UPF0313 family)
MDASYCDRIYHPKVFTDVAETLWEAILEREQPTHVAISSTYDSWHVALHLGRMARQLLPQVIIVQGGPHLDEVLEPFVLQRTPTLDPLTDATRGAVDFAVGGDGEHILRWLVEVTGASDGPRDASARVHAHKEDVQRLPGTGNLVYFIGAQRQVVRFRNPMPLNSLPFVPRHLLPVEDLYDFDCFRDETGTRKPTVTMITHRGCRARCNFCSEGLPYQGRSHAHILAEASELAAAGVQAIFLDDSTVQDDSQFIDLLRGFHDLRLEVGALTRFDQIQDSRELARMRDLGLVYLYASVEQYSDVSLDLMNKKLGTEHIDLGVHNCKEAGVELGVSLLFGLPYETPDSVSSTLDYATRLHEEGLVEYVSMSLYSYHPRTPLGQMQRHVLTAFDFNHEPPHLRHPYTGFEEGSWYHPEHVTDGYVESIHRRAHAGFGGRLVRELAKHRGTFPQSAGIG